MSNVNQKYSKAIITLSFLLVLIWSELVVSLSTTTFVFRRRRQTCHGRNCNIQYPFQQRIIPLQNSVDPTESATENSLQSNIEEGKPDQENTKNDEMKETRPQTFFAPQIPTGTDKKELQVSFVDENANNLRTAEALFDYDSAYVVFSSAIIGIICGFAVAMFKLSIETLREALYGGSLAEHFYWWLIPALGGVGVSLLAATGELSPGLRGTANEIDELSLNVNEDLRFTNAARFLRKPLAAIITLGSGCSLGPEGPSVEVGMTLSRLCMPPSIQRNDRLAEVDAAARVRRNRLLLSAGAAAGVAAGFNAPLSGVFFALEILQQNLPPLTISGATGSSLSTDKDQPDTWQQQVQQDYLSSGSGSITAILLASVLSALVSQVYLGEELALSVPSYHLNTPLVELPMVSFFSFFYSLPVFFSRIAKDTNPITTTATTTTPHIVVSLAWSSFRRGCGNLHGLGTSVKSLF